jgi:hypothetical protein
LGFVLRRVPISQVRIAEDCALAGEYGLSGLLGRGYASDRGVCHVSPPKVMITDFPFAGAGEM